MANWLQKVFRRNEEIDWMYDLELISDLSERNYLKQLAIQICVNHIADTISQSKFQIKSEKESFDRQLEYLLNKRPNRNQNASQFWQHVIYKLINDNEVLIIKTDSDELLIADEFIKTEFAFYDNAFKGVVVSGHEYERNFFMSDVFYLEYSNGQMKSIIDGLFADYGKVFGRLIDYQMHAHQIRASFKLGAIGRKDDKTKDRYQSFINKVTESISKDDVAIFPIQDGHEYTEHSSGGSSQSVEEVSKSLNGFIDKVAMALRIPTTLLYGNMADTTEASKNYMKFCINPLIKQISDEFTSKLFEREDIEQNNYGLTIRPLSMENLFDRAQAIDKLVSSGTFNRNEIREEAGWEKSEDPEMDKFLITKNYQHADGETPEGGDNE